MIKKLCMLIFFCSLAAAANAADVSEKIDQVFSGIDGTSPGCTVGIIQGDELVHRSGYGLANMELNIALDGSHIHRMGSVSKQFTAMAVLLLAEEYAIDLDSDIHQYLPDLTDYNHEVSINQILGHVAGMGDYDLIAAVEGEEPTRGSLDLKSVAGGPFRLGNEDYLSNEEFYDLVKSLPLISPPLEKWEYSNMGYIVLTLLVETVSGESLREYSHTRIFQPLGMTSTFFSDDPVEIVRNRASGYRPQETRYVTDMTNLFWVGDGGLHTNLDDMLKWDKNFYEPKLGQDPEAIMALFLTPNSDLETGRGLYANGQQVFEQNGEQVYSHTGGWLGTSTMYSRFPDKRFSSIIMCNDVSQNPVEYWSRLVQELGL